MKKSNLKRKSPAQRIAAGMAELEEAMQGTRSVSELFSVRTVEVPDPVSYDAKAVKRTRERMHVSQGVFAKLLGVSSELVEHWEQGVCAPRPIARRLLDEINRDPVDYLRRHMSHSGKPMSKAG